ncbi:hypothetical protein EB75_19740 [Mycobacterium sp. ST-F2]|nr:hypothetical protein EB75_19740 [Mycobacterium sp. ST-F2]
MIPAGMEAFNAANTAASGVISAAGSADSAAMLSAAATAIGPIGAAPYLGPYAGAQASNLAGTLLTGAVHAAIGVATEMSKVGYVAVDSV